MLDFIPCAYEYWTKYILGAIGLHSDLRFFLYEALNSPQFSFRSRIQYGGQFSLLALPPQKTAATQAKIETILVKSNYFWFPNFD